MYLFGVNSRYELTFLDNTGISIVLWALKNWEKFYAVNIFNDIKAIIDRIMVSTVAPDTIYINEKYLNSQTKKVSARSCQKWKK